MNHEWAKRYSGFIQDQWRIIPTLTINAGLRYDSEKFFGLDPILGPFQAFSLSEATLRWCAREAIVPTVLAGPLDIVEMLSHAYHDEAVAAGERFRHRTRPGIRISVGSLLPDEAPRLAEALALSTEHSTRTRSA